ncbi:nucleotidyltransferase domain-containing protein [Allosphingosinicella sp.]|uniref:nucleotidyltransferase domain-containing protein n=1 Tax=Allosphingosinicella sp. TaxID=2823234 RepID=UPI002FC12B12
MIREGFAFAIARRTMPDLRGDRLLKIILLGSYARGDWVEDPVGRYFSDFDLLVVVDREELTDVPEFWAKTDERLLE